VRYCRQKTRAEEAETQRRAVLEAERAEVERKRLEEERIREKERQRRGQLVGEASAWRRAAEIRAYAGAVRAEMERMGEAMSVEFSEWEKWALEVAGEMDPLVTKMATGRDCS